MCDIASGDERLVVYEQSYRILIWRQNPDQIYYVGESVPIWVYTDDSGSYSIYFDLKMTENSISSTSWGPYWPVASNPFLLYLSFSTAGLHTFSVKESRRSTVSIKPILIRTHAEIKNVIKNEIRLKVPKARNLKHFKIIYETNNSNVTNNLEVLTSNISNSSISSLSSIGLSQDLCISNCVANYSCVSANCKTPIYYFKPLHKNRKKNN